MNSVHLISYLQTNFLLTEDGIVYLVEDSCLGGLEGVDVVEEVLDVPQGEELQGGSTEILLLKHLEVFFVVKVIFSMLVKFQ